MDLDLKNAASSIEALTEQLEAARADAKEAEAYAEELEKERDDYAFKLADANNTYSEMHVALSEANDKLAKQNGIACVLRHAGKSQRTQKRWRQFLVFKS